MRLVCGALVSMATRTPDMWAQVTPLLMDYLDTQTDQLHSLMVGGS